MKPSRVIRLAALLAAVALVVAGCGGSAGVTSSVPAQVTASPTTSAGGQLSAADQSLLAEIQALHDDWRSGKIEIDWPPSEGDNAGELGVLTNPEELFQWLEKAVFAPQVIAFLKDEAGAAQELRAEIGDWPEVTGVQFVSKEGALARLRKDLKDHPDILENLHTNPLPASIEITVSVPASADIIGERLEARPEVDEARWTTEGYPYDTFLAWLKSHARPATAGATSTSSTSSIGLSPGEEKRLDDLDATGVAQIYFLSGDPAVELHLSAPWLRRITTQPNAVPEHEREGGTDDLVVEGPLSGVPSQVYSREEWPEQLHFRVTYTSRKMSSTGEPPGKRLWFVIIGRQTADSPWKILEIGSGP